MKFKVRRVVSAVLCASMLLALQIPAGAQDVQEPYYHTPNRQAEFVTLAQAIVLAPMDAAEKDGHTVLLPAEESKGYHKEVLALPENSGIEYRVIAPAAGAYAITVDYYISEKMMNNLMLSVRINGEYQFFDSRNIVLKSLWKDSGDTYKTDEFGHELFPEPEPVFRWQTKTLTNHIYYNSVPYSFLLEEGENIITIRTNDVPVYVGDITLHGYEREQSYEQYISSLEGLPAGSPEAVVIEGEQYAEKNESYIRGSRGTNYNSTPYDPKRKLIQSLAESMWCLPGEGVTYRFSVKEPGIYYLNFKYIQSEKTDMPVFKQIHIDGKYLFEELQYYGFPYTGTSYSNHTLNINGQPVPIYLEQGEHTLTLVSTAEPLEETYETLTGVLNRLNNIALEIKVITGDKIDKNRDWELEEYLPGLSAELAECAGLVDREYRKLSEMASKDQVADLSYLQVASGILTKFSEDLDHLVNNPDQLTQGSGSAAEYISLVLPELLSQNMGIDQISFYPEQYELPKPMRGFWSSLAEEMKMFGYSFTMKSQESQVIVENELNVWAARPVTHLDVMKEMLPEFEERHGAKVNFSVMPDEQKLLLAVSAGSAPDAVFGASSYRPFDFALRGAIYDLRQFDDFGESIASFHPEMLVPFIIEDSCYALPETANFQVLFYRKDIMEILNLDLPDTWDDVIEILPALSRYGMQFNTSIANVGGIKHFGTTIPFIQQFDGKVYSEDGTRVELGDPKTVEAFTLMTDLYTKYSLPENIPNFYANFKKGISPLGISDINTYVLLRVAAPELAGQWGIAPSVGVEQNGEVKRCQASVLTANLILKDASDPEMAWELMKWWMGDEVQVDFANQLRLRYGPEYIWNTANLNALALSNAFSEEDKTVIMEQLSHTREIPRNPAYFAVERELSNAWNSVVFDGVSPRTALDDTITKSNREITKKLKEFGYVSENGTLIKEFTMASGETVERWKSGG